MMHVLFLTMNYFTGIDQHNIYADLMLEFIKNGHKPYIVTPREKKTGEPTRLADHGDHAILTVQTGNMSGVSLIEKGIPTVTLSGQYYRAVMKHLGHLPFDLILYSTPPITLVGPVKKLKKKFGASTYLMLKDIFPQNAVDLGMFSKKSPIYRYFRRQEQALYRVSDKIGCMSPANAAFLLKHNPWIPQKNVGLCVNSVRPQPVAASDKIALRREFNLPTDKIVFVYGGNFGKPQGIDFLLQFLQQQINQTDRFFVLCGTGTEYGRVDAWLQTHQPGHIRLIHGLPKQDYDRLVQACDVGMLFLDHRFTIPNFPSRLLSYMEYGLPVLSVTDRHTDVGDVVQSGAFGWKCYSDDLDGCCETVDAICGATAAHLAEMGDNGRRYLEANYTADKTYQQIWGQVYDAQN